MGSSPAPESGHLALPLCLPSPALRLLEERAWALCGVGTRSAPALERSGSDQARALGLLALAVPSSPCHFPEHSRHGGWVAGGCVAVWPFAECWQLVTGRPGGRHFPVSSLPAQQELSMSQMRKPTESGCLAWGLVMKKSESELRSVWFQSWAHFTPLWPGSGAWASVPLGGPQLSFLLPSPVILLPGPPCVL